MLLRLPQEIGARAAWENLQNLVKRRLNESRRRRRRNPSDSSRPTKFLAEHQRAFMRMRARGSRESTTTSRELKCLTTR